MNPFKNQISRILVSCLTLLLLPALSYTQEVLGFGTDDRYTPGSGDRHFEGSIDEVRFWRAELDQETIQVVSSNTPNTKDELT
jgi:hypothetical protein